MCKTNDASQFETFISWVNSIGMAYTMENIDWRKTEIHQRLLSRKQQNKIKTLTAEMCRVAKLASIRGEHKPPLHCGILGIMAERLVRFLMPVTEAAHAIAPVNQNITKTTLMTKSWKNKRPRLRAGIKLYLLNYMYHLQKFTNHKMHQFQPITDQFQSNISIKCKIAHNLGWNRNF